MNQKTKYRFNGLVEIGCIVCRKFLLTYSLPEVHHLRENRGIGHKKKDDETIPLCPHHHRIGPQSFHEGRSFFITNYGTEQELLEWTNELLSRLNTSYK